MPQAASGPLIAALGARIRDLARPSVLVDWDRDGSFATLRPNGQRLDDLSADVDRVSVRRELTTDLPAGVRRFAGSAAATGQVTLSHRPDPATPDETTAAWYSPVNPTGPLNGKKRMAAPAKVALGFNGSAGAEYLDQLTGVVRKLVVDGQAGTATLDLFDNVDRYFRKPLTLPMVLADDQTFTGTSQKPGLHSAWIADWVFRQCGFYTSPPARANCRLSATLHGSGWPEVGTVQDFRGQNYSKLAFPPLSPGFATPAKWLAALQLSGAGGGSEQCDLVMSGTADPDNGNTLFMECWAQLDDVAHTNGSPLIQCYRTGVSEPWCVLWIDTTGRAQVSFNRGGGDNNARATGTSGPSGFVAGTWYYVAAYIEWANANTKVWIRKDGTTTGPITIAAGSTTTSPAFNTVHVGQGKGAGFSDTELDGRLEAVQVTTEAGGGSPPAWNDAFVPTAEITGSFNELVAMPSLGRVEAWEILKQLAAAELAMVGTTEGGKPYYRDREWFTRSPQNTSQETITTLGPIETISVEEDVDSVRNHWIIRASPPQVGSPTEDVWKLTDPTKIAANSAKTIPAKFDNPAAYVDTSITSHGAAGNSRYNASTTRDGSGSVVSNLSFQVTAYADFAIIVVTNPNAFPVWLVGNSGVASVAQGIASLRLVGQPVIFGQSQSTPGGSDAIPTTSGVNTRVQSEASDATSITNYGERVFDDPDFNSNPFLQDLDSTDLTAAAGVAYTKDPKAVVTGLRVVGNPRRQLGDRATIQDPDGLKLSGDFHLAAIATEQDEDVGMVQTIDVRGI
jgi:hypothetical protein